MQREINLLNLRFEIVFNYSNIPKVFTTDIMIYPAQRGIQKVHLLIS